MLPGRNEPKKVVTDRVTSTSIYIYVDRMPAAALDALFARLLCLVWTWYVGFCINISFFLRHLKRFLLTSLVFHALGHFFKNVFSPTWSYFWVFFFFSSFPRSLLYLYCWHVCAVCALPHPLRWQGCASFILLAALQGRWVCVMGLWWQSLGFIGVKNHYNCLLCYQILKCLPFSVPFFVYFSGY